MFAPQPQLLRSGRQLCMSLVTLPILSVPQFSHLDNGDSARSSVLVWVHICSRLITMPNAQETWREVQLHSILHSVMQRERKSFDLLVHLPNAPLGQANARNPEPNLGSPRGAAGTQLVGSASLSSARFPFAAPRPHSAAHAIYLPRSWQFHRLPGWMTLTMLTFLRWLSGSVFWLEFPLSLHWAPGFIMGSMSPLLFFVFYFSHAQQRS